MAGIGAEVARGVLAGDALPCGLARMGAGLSLRFLGNVALADEAGVGVCGSRRASAKSLGLMRRSVERLVGDGYVIVSGNAAGIDREAHLAALERGGATIMVLPHGMGHFRIPVPLRPVWDWRRVLVLSQFAEREGWAVGRAMLRNRTIMGLSRALMVMEAGAAGGTMAAGLEALRLGLPLHVFEYASAAAAPGNRILLGRGAIPIKKQRADGAPNLRRLLGDLAARPPARPATAPLF